MRQEAKIRDLGCANGWHEDSIERKLVEMTRNAGFSFSEEFLPPHTYRYTCTEAGITYYTNCS